MFRRTLKGLKQSYPDPTFEHDLEKLGFRITEDDTIRSLERPNYSFKWRFTNNDRYNDVRLETMHECVRREIDKRMAQQGVPLLYLPQLSATKPTDEPHVQIYATPASSLKTKKRVIVVTNADEHELGVWSWRLVMGDAGINAGSAVSLARELARRGSETGDADNTSGLVVLNPGQLRYSVRQDKALSKTGWDALPKQSMLLPDVAFDPVLNTVGGHREPREHIKTVFETIVNNRDFVSKEAEVFVIAIDKGASALLDLMVEDWAPFKHVVAFAFIEAQSLREAASSELRKFLRDNAKHWTLTEKPAEEHFCPTIFEGQGEEYIRELLFPRVFKDVLDFFDSASKRT